MAGDKIQPLLGRQAKLSADDRRRRLIGRIEAVIGIALVSWLFWVALHYVHDHIQKGRHGLIPTYPFMGVICIASICPFIMFLSFPGDFSPRLHPLNPADYIFLLRRLGGAAKTGNMKITSKEL